MEEKITDENVSQETKPQETKNVSQDTQVKQDYATKEDVTQIDNAIKNIDKQINETMKDIDQQIKEIYSMQKSSVTHDGGGTDEDEIKY